MNARTVLSPKTMAIMSPRAPITQPRTIPILAALLSPRSIISPGLKCDDILRFSVELSVGAGCRKGVLTLVRS